MYNNKLFFDSKITLLFLDSQHALDFIFFYVAPFLKKNAKYYVSTNK